MLRNQEATFLKHLEDTASCCRESVHGRKFEIDRTKVCVDFKIRIFVVFTGKYWHGSRSTGEGSITKADQGTKCWVMIQV